MKLFDKKYPLPILLCSTSPYRKEQLQSLGYEFSSDSPLVDEEVLKKTYAHLPVEDLALQLAKAKAESLLKKYPRHVLIGADQICHLDKQVFSKPKTVDNAIKQLKSLQGHTHTLTTAVCVSYQNKSITHVNQTHLKMRSLIEQDIVEYITLDQPLYCAGSYMFEKNGQKLFESIRTDDPSSIIGLPLMALQTILLQLANGL
jgi:septum formation protein